MTIQVYGSMCLTFTLMNIHDHVSLIKAARVSVDCNLSEFNNIATIHYRPQRSCGQGYVFTRVCDSVILLTGGSAPLHAGIYFPPPGPRQAHPWTKADTPLQTKGRPPRIRLMSGRYASYWNAFLFYLFFVKCGHFSLISLHIRSV